MHGNPNIKVSILTELPRSMLPSGSTINFAEVKMYTESISKLCLYVIKGKTTQRIDSVSVRLVSDRIRQRKICHIPVRPLWPNGKIPSYPSDRRLRVSTSQTSLRMSLLRMKAYPSFFCTLICCHTHPDMSVHKPFVYIYIYILFLYTVGSRFTTGSRSRIFGCKSNRLKMSTI